MPEITFNVPTEVAQRIQAIALTEGFANGKQWVKNLIRQALITRYVEASKDEQYALQQAAEQQARSHAEEIT